MLYDLAIAIYDITELIGKEETLARIQRAVDALK